MNPITHILLNLYKYLNKTGALKNSTVQSLFIKSYFAYKKHLEDANAKLIKNYPTIFQGGHVLDIGANIGYTSYVFSKAINQPYKVFAFEPEQNNLQILKKVAQRFNLQNKIVINPVAVGNIDGEIELWQNNGHHADHRILTEELRKQLNTAIQTQKMPIITIDHFLKTENAIDKVAFIKIDVQGYELPVCEGMQETLKRNPNCVIGFEYCPSIMESLGYHAENLLLFFKQKHFNFYKLQKNGVLSKLNLESDKIIKMGQKYLGYFDIICSRTLLC